MVGQSTLLFGVTRGLWPPTEGAMTVTCLWSFDRSTSFHDIGERGVWTGPV